MPLTATLPYSRQTAEQLAEMNDMGDDSSRAAGPRSYHAVCINAARDYWAVAVRDKDNELIGYL
jgi:hypothetical protein